MSEPSSLPCVGDVIDEKFRIERKLGEGGTSTIYEVRHVITDKPFVIKWLSPELADNELAVARFIHEARVCGKFKHPNAVEIYDICRTDDSFWLLMELLEGESLEQRLERLGRLSAKEAVDVLLPCIDALAAAHRLGIVHRDLKPSNIFLCRVDGRSEEVPKVLDFGISKLSLDGHDLSPITTTTRTVVGTPLYMAPEQMRGHAAEPQFDIYALGVVLYELVAGQPPFECETFADLVFKIIEGQQVRLDEVAEVDAAFADIVAKAMARDAENRFVSMDELGAVLRPYASNAAAASGAVQLARTSANLASVRAVGNLAPVTMGAKLARPTGSSVRVRSSAGVIAAPQPSAALARVIDVIPKEPLEAFDTTQSMEIQRSRGVRMVGVALLLALALAVAWNTSAREARPATASLPQVVAQHAAAPSQPEVTAPAVDSAEHTALFTEHATRDALQPTAALPPVFAAHEKTVADVSVVKSARRPARPRAVEPSEHASAKHAEPPARSEHAAKLAEPPARVERKEASDGIAIPKASLSKRDF